MFIAPWADQLTMCMSWCSLTLHSFVSPCVVNPQRPTTRSGVALPVLFIYLNWCCKVHQLSVTNCWPKEFPLGLGASSIGTIMAGPWLATVRQIWRLLRYGGVRSERRGDEDKGLALPSEQADSDLILIKSPWLGWVKQQQAAITELYSPRHRRFVWCFPWKCACFLLTSSNNPLTCCACFVFTEGKKNNLSAFRLSEQTPDVST